MGSRPSATVADHAQSPTFHLNKPLRARRAVAKTELPGQSSGRSRKSRIGSIGVPAHGQNLIYEQGHWELRPGQRELRAAGVVVPIGPRAFEIIEVLVQSANELVTKDD